MNSRLYIALWLAGFALAAQAQEPPPDVATGDRAVAAQPANLEFAGQVQLGAELTDRVMTDVAARVADDLETRLEREVGGDVAVETRRKALLVSSN